MKPALIAKLELDTLVDGSARHSKFEAKLGSRESMYVICIYTYIYILIYTLGSVHSCFKKAIARPKLKPKEEKGGSGSRTPKLLGKDCLDAARFLG